MKSGEREERERDYSKDSFFLLDTSKESITGNFYGAEVFEVSILHDSPHEDPCLSQEIALTRSEPAVGGSSVRRVTNSRQRSCSTEKVTASNAKYMLPFRKDVIKSEKARICYTRSCSFRCDTTGWSRRRTTGCPKTGLYLRIRRAA